MQRRGHEQRVEGAVSPCQSTSTEKFAISINPFHLMCYNVYVIFTGSVQRADDFHEPIPGRVRAVQRAPVLPGPDGEHRPRAASAARPPGGGAAPPGPRGGHRQRAPGNGVLLVVGGAQPPRRHLVPGHGQPRLAGGVPEGGYFLHSLLCDTNNFSPSSIK